MRYEFKDREEMLGMYNSIPTPHSHGIVIDGNNLVINGIVTGKLAIT